MQGFGPASASASHPQLVFWIPWELPSHEDVPMRYVLCRYLGQQNPTDNFTRLLASLVYTGIAPQSFYKDPNGPDRHYDGM